MGINQLQLSDYLFLLNYKEVLSDYLMTFIYCPVNMTLNGDHLPLQQTMKFHVAKAEDQK